MDSDRNVDNMLDLENKTNVKYAFTWMLDVLQHPASGLQQQSHTYEYTYKQTYIKPYRH